MSRAAAFFDLDKTLMAGSSGMQFARVAARGGVVSRRQLAGWGVEHLRYRLRGTTDERTNEVLRVARDLITGVPATTIERMGPEVMAAILPRVYPQMLEEVHAHQDAGRPTFIVSAAGNDVVESLAAVLGMEGGIGTRYEVDPDPPLAAIAKEEGWQTLRFERLGRRLTAVAVTVLATVAGFGASRVAANRRPAPRRFRLPRG